MIQKANIWLRGKPSPQLDTKGYTVGVNPLSPEISSLSRHGEAKRLFSDTHHNQLHLSLCMICSRNRAQTQPARLRPTENRLVQKMTSVGLIPSFPKNTYQFRVPPLFQFSSQPHLEAALLAKDSCCSQA